MRQLILFSYLMLHLSTLIAAEPIDISSMTDSEIEGLSASEQGRIPVFDYLARIAKDDPEFDKPRGGVIAGLETLLYDLRYYRNWPTGKASPSLTKAIADFQADLDHDSTGNLLMGEFEELKERHDAFQPEPLMLSTLLISIHMRIDQVMIGSFLSNTEVGLYSVAVRSPNLVRR